MKAFDCKLPVVGKEEFVRYASITGDFNPVHYDLETAKHLRLPNVISQGPLTFTLALDAIASEIGLDAITSMSARTTAPVMPSTELNMLFDQDGNLSVSDGEVTFLKGEVKQS